MDPARASPNNLSSSEKFSFQTVFWEHQNKHQNLKRILSSSKNLARGRCGLTKKFFSNLPADYKTIMLEIVNGSLSLGKYYDFWRVSKVTPIPKRSKSQKTLAGWRQISVGCLFGTLVEKIAAGQFQDYIERNSAYFISQHGFRKNHSTATAIAELTNSIRLKYTENYLISIAIDAANAFGSPAHYCILEKMYNFCDKMTFKWFTEFLENRAFYVQMQDKRSDIVKLPNRGLPQGSGMGPIGWNWTFNSVLSDLHSQLNTIFECKILAYADDLVITTSATIIDELQSNVNKIITETDQRLRDIQVARANGKSQGFLIGECELNHIDHKGEKIDVSRSLKYLGVVLSSFDPKNGKNVKTKLINIEKHLENILSKIKQYRHQVLSMKEYATVKKLVILYNSLFMGQFSHGLECQPMLSKQWYSKFQTEFCNFIKIIINRTYSEAQKPISYDELLKKFNLRSVKNTHKYLALNRINQVFMSKKPVNLYNILKHMVRDNLADRHEHEYIKGRFEYKEFKNINYQTPDFNPNDYCAIRFPGHFYDLKVPNYERKIRYLANCVDKLDIYLEPFYMKNGAILTPEELIDIELFNRSFEKPNKLQISTDNNVNISDAWPNCFVGIFNELPKSVRANFGSKYFKLSLKNHFRHICQHSNPRDTCSTCYRPPDYGSKIVCEKIKLWGSEYYKNRTDENRLFIIKLMLYHPAFKSFFKKFQCTPDWKKVFRTWSSDLIWDSYIELDESYRNLEFLYGTNLNNSEDSVDSLLAEFLEFFD